MTENLIFLLANYLILLMFVGLGVLWFLGKIDKRVAVRALLVASVSWFGVELVKQLVPTIRPFMLTGEAPLTILMPGVATFPSSHAAVAFGLATSVARHSKRFGAVFFLGALLVGAGRVLANVHYPIDIVGGAIIGGVLALILDY